MATTTTILIADKHPEKSDEQSVSFKDKLNHAKLNRMKKLLIKICPKIAMWRYDMNLIFEYLHIFHIHSYVAITAIA